MQTVASPVTILRRNTGIQKRILLISDHLESASVLSSRVKVLYNCKVTVAYDLFEAINLLSSNCFDLIVVDWYFSTLNCEQVLDFIESNFKGSSLKYKTIPLVYLSETQANRKTNLVTKHLKHVGYINKIQPISNIVHYLKFYLTDSNDLLN